MAALVARPTLIGQLGHCALGGATFGREIDASAAFALMDHATARGVTHFDTAAGYSAGESERIVGAWLASRRPAHAPLIATKIKPPYTPQEIARKIHESRARLNVDIIDLLYLHQWSDDLLHVECLAALDRAVTSGETRFIGVSNFNAAQLRAILALQRAHGLAPIRALQNNHNFAVRDVDRELRSLCAENDIAIVTYSPLGAGFLTGKHKHGVAAGSRFEVIPGHQNVYFKPEAWARLAQLEAIAARTSDSPAALALQWALHQPGPATVLVGGRFTAQIDQAFAALARGRPDWLETTDE